MTCRLLNLEKRPVGDGKPLPDVNSRLYASMDWQAYDVVVPTRPDAVSAQIAFVSKKGAFVKDVTMRRISAEEACQWCYKYYATLPRLDYVVPKDAWAKLPNAKTAIKVAKDYRIVFLGDSIMNDSWCGNFGSTLKRDFPDTNFKFYLSVRGSTGCWYYHEKEHFDEYVAKFRPNLVVIGGISNWLGPQNSTVREAEDWMVETIDRCKAIARSGKPLDWYKRDKVHNNDRGKQIITMTLGEFFRAANR